MIRVYYCMLLTVGSDFKRIFVATYKEGINNYNPNILNGIDPSGDTFDRGRGLDWCSGVGNDTFNISGGLVTAPYKNLFQCSGTNNVIYLNGFETYLFLGEFSPGDHIQQIIGTSTDNGIWASAYPQGQPVSMATAMTRCAKAALIEDLRSGSNC